MTNEEALAKIDAILLAEWDRAAASPSLLTKVLGVAMIARLKTAMAEAFRS